MPCSLGLSVGKLYGDRSNPLTDYFFIFIGYMALIQLNHV